MKRTDPLALVLTCITLQAAASADLITWGPVQTIASSAEVSTSGTSVAAYNTWANTLTSPTVNGIFFSAYAPPGWNNGGWSLLAGSTTGDGEYDDLLDSARATSESSITNPTGWGGIRLDSIATLAAGNVYEIQVWYSDQRPGSATNVLPDRVMNLSSATGAAALATGIVTNLTSLTQGAVSGGLEADPNNMSGAGDTAIGSYAIGTFTRTTSEELWLLIQGTHPVAANVLRPHINAFQIRDVTNAGSGINYCTANVNSSGQASVMSGMGSTTASNNDVTLVASQMPNSVFGFFITSQTQGFVQNPGGSAGNLCVSGAVGRYVGPGQVQNSGGAGMIQLALDLTSTPTPTGFVSITSGETWNFQAWHRDSIGGTPTSNFTDGLSVAFN